MKELLKKQRQLVAVYAVWFFINLVVLFMSFAEKESYCKKKFWPFDACDLTESYDFSEFLVYAIGPAILIFAYLMFTKRD